MSRGSFHEDPPSVRKANPHDVNPHDVQLVHWRIQGGI